LERSGGIVRNLRNFQALQRIYFRGRVFYTLVTGEEGDRSMEVILRKIRVFFAAFVAAGAAFAQDLPTGIMRAGTISLLRTSSKISAGPPLGTVDTTMDQLIGGFQAIDYSKLPRFDTPAVTTIGSCFVVSFGPTQNTPAFDPTAVTILDAGPVLNLTGPNGSKPIAANKFTFGATLGGGLSLPFLPPPAPLYLDPGTYTVDNGAGGADVGPFTATLNVPTQFVWTNADAALSIDRSAGIDIVWTGGDPDSKVNIQGSVTVISPTTRMLQGGGSFTCTENNSAGHFFVTPEVMQILPPSTTVNNVSNGTLSVSDGVEVKFDAPGSDLSTFTFRSGAARSPEYK
jgi:hypothetical protein